MPAGAAAAAGAFGVNDGAPGVNGAVAAGLKEAPPGLKGAAAPGTNAWGPAGAPPPPPPLPAPPGVNAAAPTLKLNDFGFLAWFC